MLYHQHMPKHLRVFTLPGLGGHHTHHTHQLGVKLIQLLVYNCFYCHILYIENTKSSNQCYVDSFLENLNVQSLHWTLNAIKLRCHDFYVGAEWGDRLTGTFIAVRKSHSLYTSSLTVILFRRFFNSAQNQERIISLIDEFHQDTL